MRHTASVGRAQQLGACEAVDALYGAVAHVVLTRSDMLSINPSQAADAASSVTKTAVNVTTAQAGHDVQGEQGQVGLRTVDPAEYPQKSWIQTGLKSIAVAGAMIGVLVGLAPPPAEAHELYAPTGRALLDCRPYVGCQYVPEMAPVYHHHPQYYPQERVVIVERERPVIIERRSDRDFERGVMTGVIGAAAICVIIGGCR